MNNNPPAFPTFNDPGSREAACGHIVQGGMTLRDYFAAAAMQGFRSCDSFSDEDHESVAKMAYDQADAMLQAREK